MAVKASGSITLVRVDDGARGTDGQMLYATCATASATAAKVATLSSGALTLTAGATVAVRFTNANTASSPTLNVGGTGAKAIYTQGVRYAFWSAGSTVVFTYDGSYWRVASEPVYANTATIGNPAGYHLYFDGTNIWFRCGSTVLAAYNSAEINISDGAVIVEDGALTVGTPIGGPTSYRARVRIEGEHIRTAISNGETFKDAIDFLPDGVVNFYNPTKSNSPLISKADRPSLFRSAFGNLKTENNEEGMYIYEAYQTENGAPSDWSGSMYVFRAAQGDEKILKYAFTTDGQIYFMRVDAGTNAVEKDWTQI